MMKTSIILIAAEDLSDAFDGRQKSSKNERTYFSNKNSGKQGSYEGECELCTIL